MDDVFVLTDNTGIREFIKESGINPNQCTQCGKCSGICPLTFAMEYTPTVVMRFLQIEKIGPLLNSKTIWVCTGCKSCTAYCPRGIDVSRIIDFLRIVARRKGNIAKVNPQVAFGESLLTSLKSCGRFYSLGPGFKLSVIKLFKGKIRLFLPGIKDKKQLKKSIDNILKYGSAYGE